MMELQLEDIHYYNDRVYCVKFDCFTLQEALNDMAQYSKGVESDVKAVYAQNSTLFRKKADSDKFLVVPPYSPTLVDYDMRNEICEFGKLYEYPTYHLYKVYLR